MGVKPTATLAHFDEVFTRSADPWQTRSSWSEKHKRDVILAQMGPAIYGRVLELGCGNGSNSTHLAQRALSLEACDGAAQALRHAAAETDGLRNITFHHLPLPARFPSDCYDVIVIAELLYYLNDRCLTATMREIDRTLRPGGLLLLCHHHRQFDDAAQLQCGLHERFVGLSQYRWKPTRRHRTSRWVAQSFRRPLQGWRRNEADS